MNGVEKKIRPGKGSSTLIDPLRLRERWLADLHLRITLRTALGFDVWNRGRSSYAVHAEVRRSDNGFRGWLADNREAASTGRRTH